MASPSNHSFCDMIIMVKKGGDFLEVIKGPALDTYLKSTLMICWMSIILHRVNVDRSTKSPGRRSGRELQHFLTLTSLATSASFLLPNALYATCELVSACERSSSKCSLQRRFASTLSSCSVIWLISLYVCFCTRSPRFSSLSAASKLIALTLCAVSHHFQNLYNSLSSTFLYITSISKFSANSCKKFQTATLNQ